MKKLVLIMILAVFILAVTALAAPDTVTIVGSTSVQPLSEELASVFMNKRKNVKIFVQGGGSGAGIKAAMDGTADFGASSRLLKPEEKKAGLYEAVIARDGIAVIVHPSNKVSNLTIEQLQKIYTGEYTHWKQVGGANQTITVVNREAGSGTRGAFEEIVLDKLVNHSRSLVQASTGAVQQTVAVTKGAIGYVSLGSLDTGIVKPLTINGVACTESNIVAQKYPIQRPFLYLAKKAPAGAAKEFLEWILSAEGQKIVAQDFIPVNR